jgi:predicted ribosomally synthesized peptide with nif11-like leader
MKFVYINELEEKTMPIDKTKLTKEMLEKAAQCETADELVALAKAEGFTLTKEEAEAYLAELEDMELDDAALDNVAGGLPKTCSHGCIKVKSIY